ncbi:unnamed protein product [Calypogeia fissa]
MGAGRRTETVHFNLATGGSGHKVAPQRKLAERNRLGSVIFGCTTATYNECITNKIFGLPMTHITYVEHIVVGMPIFLFNYTERKMHGIFEAASEGALNISQYAWTGSTDGARTNYPAQVRVKLRSDFSRLVSVPESVFKEVLIDSYYEDGRFYFEVDSEQTDRLIKLFEERAITHTYRPAVPKSSLNAWQPATPSKVWKTRDADDKLKQPAKVVISEDGKAQYIPSSSKELPDEDAGLHQQNYWNRRPINGDESLSDESDDLQTSYKGPDTTSEAQMRRPSSSDKPEMDPVVQMRLANGYKPKLSGSSEPQVSVSEGVGARTELTASQREVASEILTRLGKITQVTSVAKETQTPQQQLVPQVQAQREVELAIRNPINGVTEWERIARDRSAQEQALLREEREKLSATLSVLDFSIGQTVQKNLDLYAMAIAQMRQDGIELRRILDEARMRPEELERVAALESSQVTMAAEVQALKQEVVDLRRQLELSGTREKLERIQENGSSQLSIIEFPDNQIPPAIYLIGGLGDQLSRLESVMVWSPATDRLKTAAPMLTPRCCAGASVLDGHVYVFGGGDGSSWYDTVERYDRRDDQWRACAPMKIKRGSLGGVTVGDRIFAVGGGNGLVSFSEVESYDPYLGTWLPCTSMFEKRFCVAATEFGGALYALGGFDGEQYLMSMERFDPREALWTRMPPMSTKRGSLSAAVLNGKIYALGGYDGDGILDAVETFDPRAGRWEAGHQMCCQRAYGAVAVVGEALYYMGGLAEDEAVDSGGYRSWRSQSQASWQQYILGSSIPGLGINSSYQIQRFTEATGWQSMRPRVIGKRSCLAAVVF